MNVPVQDFYRDEYVRVQSSLPGQRVPWVQAMRKDALECFLSTGLPTTRQEDWKYTSMRALQRRQFHLNDTRAAMTRKSIQRYLPQATPSINMVFVDGLWVPEFSTAEIPGGVTIASLARLLEDAPDILGRSFGSLASAVQPGFIALTTSLMRDGACVVIDDHVRCDPPIHLVFISSGKDSTMTPRRNLVVVGQDARATLVERHVCLNSGEYLTTGVSEVLVGRQASLTHCRIVEDSHTAFHISDSVVSLNEAGRYELHDVSAGARLLRNNVLVSLDAAGSECILNGLTLADKRQHMDNHVRVEHVSPEGTSQQRHRGVLKDHARTVFDGRVVVHQGAQKTDARQSSHNLLLSDDAEADAKPQLEIYADDVKCAHGCTVGQLDADALFYLRSRGLGEPEAKGMLVRGFTADVLECIPDEAFRRLAETKLEAYLE